jgi:hypothetical protein
MGRYDRNNIHEQGKSSAFVLGAPAVVSFSQEKARKSNGSVPEQCNATSGAAPHTVQAAMARMWEWPSAAL